MLIVDSALRRRAAEGRPIRVGMIGAGAIGRGVALQVATAVPGMEIAAIANRSIDNAEHAYRAAGASDVRQVSDAKQLSEAVAAGVPTVTDDPYLLTRSDDLDVIYEVTGAVEFGAHLALDSIAHGKHTLTMNAEMQGTVGPILKRKADEAGVVFSDSDGDQPGVMMNLYRFVRGIGVRPVLLGNMKGLQDEYRNPTTQEEFARRNHLTPHMAASFADGTKMSFEMALVANATGFRAGCRGLYGPSAQSVQEAASLLPLDQMLEVGLVDYIVGAEPAPGVFCLGTHDDPEQQRWLNLYKLGEGPLYTFYTPYHLCHLEAPTTIARAVLFGDAAVTPDAGHIVDVVATAKRDLEPGEMIDGIGWYLTYGQCENVETASAENLLPMGLAEGCVMSRPVKKDQTLTYDDVKLPEGRLVDQLRSEQAAFFG